MYINTNLVIITVYFHEYIIHLTAFRLKFDTGTQEICDNTKKNL